MCIKFRGHRLFDNMLLGILVLLTIAAGGGTIVCILLYSSSAAQALLIVCITGMLRRFRAVVFAVFE